MTIVWCFLIVQVLEDISNSTKYWRAISQVNIHKYFYSNRISVIWNALHSTVVYASSLNVLSGYWIVLN